MSNTKISLSRTNQFWIFQLVGWGIWVFLQVFRDLLIVPPDYIFLQAAVYSVNAFAAILITALLRFAYNLVWEKGVAIRFLVVWFGSVVASLLWQPFRNLIQFFPIDQSIDFSNIDADSLFDGTFSIAFPLMITWSALYFIVKYYQLFQVEKEKSLRSEALAHEAQLRMLRYQLNPHFLFNTLNAISTLVLDQSTQKANDMVTKLSKFLRYTLDQSPFDRVDLNHEVGTLRLYLDIEKVRFAERLRIEVHVEAAAGKALVPSMLLQPLIENSIKHAISKSIEGGCISIHAGKSGDNLVMTVADDGPGLNVENDAEASKGVGVSNIRNRLQEIYGEKHEFSFCNTEPRGCKATIVIPYEELGVN